MGHTQALEASLHALVPDSPIISLHLTVSLQFPLSCPLSLPLSISASLSLTMAYQAFKMQSMDQ